MQAGFNGETSWKTAWMVEEKLDIPVLSILDLGIIYS